LLREDQVLEGRRIQRRLESAADGIAAVLDRHLAEYEEQLSALAAAPKHQTRIAGPKLAIQAGEDALVVVSDRNGVAAYPSGHLLYYPWLPARGEAPENVFAAGEAIEFQRNDPAGASAVFRELARAPDPAIRAGALLRLARQARCGLLEEMARLPELSREARALYSDLQNGRWMLLRTAYRFHSDEARRRLKPDRELEAEQARERERLALAEGVEWLWDVWQSQRRGEGELSGRRGLWLAGRFVSLIWNSQPERMAALVTGPRWVEGQALGRIRPVAQRHGVTVVATDAEGHAVSGQARPASSQQVVRSPAQTRLPWTLRIASLDPLADVAEVAARRRILLAGFGVMAMVILAGTYFMARAMSRELEAARLKSDFVAAVSHEFRTPLASMCQIAELFADDRVPGKTSGDNITICSSAKHAASGGWWRTCSTLRAWRAAPGNTGWKRWMRRPWSGMSFRSSRKRWRRVGIGFNPASTRRKRSYRPTGRPCAALCGTCSTTPSSIPQNAKPSGWN